MTAGAVASGNGLNNQLSSYWGGDTGSGGNDLVCTISATNDVMRISNWKLGANYQVDYFHFTDGLVAAKDIH
jgi:hypothetical protein